MNPNTPPNSSQYNSFNIHNKVQNPLLFTSYFHTLRHPHFLNYSNFPSISSQTQLPFNYLYSLPNFKTNYIPFYNNQLHSHPYSQYQNNNHIFLLNQPLNSFQTQNQALIQLQAQFQNHQHAQYLAQFQPQTYIPALVESHSEILPYDGCQNQTQFHTQNQTDLPHQIQTETSQNINQNQFNELDLIIDSNIFENDSNVELGSSSNEIEKSTNFIQNESILDDNFLFQEEIDLLKLANANEEFEEDGISSNEDIQSESFIDCNKEILPVKRKHNNIESLNNCNIKKRSCYRQTNKLPMIIKKDFRRFFAQMMNNVMNSSNFELIHNFYLHFFSPNAQVINSLDIKSPFSTQAPSKKTILKLDLHGFLLFHLYETAKAPDEIFSIDNIKIHQFKNSKNSILSFNGYISLTQVYEIKQYPKHLISSMYNEEIKEGYISKLIHDYNSVKFGDRNLFEQPNEEIINLTNNLYSDLIYNKKDIKEIIKVKPMNKPIFSNLSLLMRILFDENHRVIAVFSSQFHNN